MEGKPSNEELARACRRIIDSASALFTNVDALANGAPPGQQELVDDSRKSVQRIVKLASTLRAAVEGKKVNLDDLL